jgi:hypothetical protein
MAGAQGRRLRRRAASSSVVAPPEAGEAPRKTRLASKRSANNENNASGFPQPARKRAALSNLTNNASSCKAVQASKVRVSVDILGSCACLGFSFFFSDRSVILKLETCIEHFTSNPCP